MPKFSVSRFASVKLQAAKDNFTFIFLIWFYCGNCFTESFESAWEYRHIIIIQGLCFTNWESYFTFDEMLSRFLLTKTNKSMS